MSDDAIGYVCGAAVALGVLALCGFVLWLILRDQ